MGDIVELPLSLAMVVLNPQRFRTLNEPTVIKNVTEAKNIQKLLGIQR